ncbi:MAG: hypothetical protein HQK63_07625 [Desulfamplus sp.]|nr:hypothetical protein [Desulfamplus sp.]
MQTYTYEHIIEKIGVLTLKNLPFNVGDKVEIVIIPESKNKQNNQEYPFWGIPIDYINPTDPVHVKTLNV